MWCVRVCVCVCGGGDLHCRCPVSNVTSSVSTCKRMQRSNIRAFRHPGATVVLCSYQLSLTVSIHDSFFNRSVMIPIDDDTQSG